MIRTHEARAGALALLVLAMMGPATAATINLYAAGSLQNALTDVATAYQSATGNTVSAKYGHRAY
jgi:ABC-type molybdate transport system substrate-binding protein